MRRKVTLTTVLAVLAAGSVASAEILGASYSYKPGFWEDFDRMGLGTNAPCEGTDTYWSVFANQEFAGRLNLATNWGGTMAGYNAQGTASDRHLSMYVTGTPTAYLTARFRNDTGADLDEIEIYYDLECSWVRFTATNILDANYRTAGFNVSYSTNQAGWTAMPGFGAIVGNDLSPPATTWFTDSEMDLYFLASRGLGGKFTLPATLPQGQPFFIRWTLVTGGLNKNMNVGIDRVAGPPAITLLDFAATATNTVAISSIGTIASGVQVLQYGTDLVWTNWQDVATNAVPACRPSTNRWEVEVPADRSGFYRIVER